jgi:hypothetical protein
VPELDALVPLMREVERAKHELEDAYLAAADAGACQRKIADYVGSSTATVLRAVERAEERRARRIRPAR